MTVVLKKHVVSDPSPTAPMEKGTYRLWPRGNVLNVIIACPGCGATQGLSHEIGTRGTISPSLVCGYNCGFHDYGRLEDWTEGALASDGTRLQGLAAHETGGDPAVFESFYFTAPDVATAAFIKAVQGPGRPA
jgi:hypothetical protein